MVALTIFFLSCSNRQSKSSAGEAGGVFDEANLPAAEKEIWKAMNIYDSNMIRALTDTIGNGKDRENPV